MMYLDPGEAVVVFIRKNNKPRCAFMVGVRKAESMFHADTNELQIGESRLQVCELGSFDELEIAVCKAIDALHQLQSKRLSILKAPER